MTKKGDMLYAWTNDAEIQKKAELGGAVTSLWKHASRPRPSTRSWSSRKGGICTMPSQHWSPTLNHSRERQDRSTAVRFSSPNWSRRT